MISPSTFAAEIVRLETELAKARRKGDIRGMQAALAELTALKSAYYGGLGALRPSGLA